MKKILKYFLVVALMLVQIMPLTVKAERGIQTNDGTITINKAEVGQKYEIYKLFDLESYNEEKEAYTYTISSTSAWFPFVSEEGEGVPYITLTKSTGTNYVVEWNGNDSKERVAEFARKALTFAESNNLANNGQKIATKYAEDGYEDTTKTKVTFEGLSLGYYVIDSSLGTLVALNTTVKNAEIDEKNTPTTVKKEVYEDTTKTWGEKNTASLGETVSFKIEINAKKGAQNYVLTDTMVIGLTSQKDAKIYVGANAETELSKENYTISYTDATATTGDKFEVKFAQSYLDSIQEETLITVKYTAVVNEKAEILGKGNDNDIVFTYGDDTELTDKTKTYVLSFKVQKNDGSNLLDGAEFELYGSVNENDLIELVELTDEAGNIYYRVATATDKSAVTNFVSAKIRVNNAVIKGLDDNTIYYLEETKAPEGFNKLTSRIPVEITTQYLEDGTAVSHVNSGSNTNPNLVVYELDTVKVTNLTGGLLPSTGGMGTVLFITIGSIMVLLFGVLLVTKLRLSKMSI